MVEPIQGLPSNPLIDRLASTFGADAVQSFLGYLDRGVPVGQAFSMAFGNDVRHGGDLDLGGLMQAITDLPSEVQQRIAQGADTLPPPVRDALDRLGIAQPQPRGHGAEPAAGARDGVPGQAAAQAFGTSEARAANAPGQAANAFAAQEAAPRYVSQQTGAQQIGVQQAGPAQHADRAFNDAALVQQHGHGAEALAGGRIADAGQAVAMTDRTGSAQQQMQAQALPPAHGRAEALAAQVMPALAGATMLGNPQANPLPGQVTAPAPPGTDVAAAQARDAQLAPAGHTVAGFLRRDLRRGGVQPAGEPPRGALLALLPGRRRRAEDENGASSFQWLFWVLTVIAYGAVAVAVISMIPNGGGLTDGYGRPTYGGYALAIGAAAAIGSWFVGRRLSGRP